MHAIALAQHALFAVCWRRRFRPEIRSAYLVTVLAGSLVFDASHFPCDPGWTVGLVQARVVAGTLTLVVPPGVDVITEVRTRWRGRLESPTGQDRAKPHLVLRGVVLLGRIRVVRSG